MCLAGLVAVAAIVVLRSAQIVAAGYSWDDVRAFNPEAGLLQGLGALVIIIFGSA